MREMAVDWCGLSEFGKEVTYKTIQIIEVF
jgi:hypothetical protein